MSELGLTLNTPEKADFVSAYASSALSEKDAPLTSAKQPASTRARGALTLEDAVRKALSWHPSVDEAVSRLNQSKDQIEVARSGYRPKIRAGISSNYERGYGSDSGIQPQLSASASQMIFDFGKVDSEVQAGIAGTEISRAQLLLAVDNLIQDTASAVIETQRYRALLAVAHEQVAGVEAITSLVSQRSQKGASTRSDEVQAQARLQAAQARVLELQGQLSRWEATLASLTGANGRIALRSDAPAWLTKACEVQEPDWSQVPGMLEADAQRKKAEAQLALNKAQIFPTLSLEASTRQDIDGSLLGRSDRLSSERSDYTIGLNLSGNLYDGGATSARSSAASHALSAADAAREKIRSETRRSMAEARSQAGSMKLLLTSLSSRGEMMSETRDLYRQQYLDLGTRTLLDLLNAEQELYASRFDEVNTTYDLRRLGMDCLFNAGMLRKSFGLTGTTVRGVSL
jgi:adhesin transport system outer membrane protein